MEEIKAEIDRILEDSPNNIIFGADCTSPDGTTTAKIREIIDYVHNWRQTHKK
jgi:uroporphyrinogen decarboxylase